MENVPAKEWLEQCKQWTEKDDTLFEEGKKSGTAINRKTGKPMTIDDLKIIHELLPY